MLGVMPPIAEGDTLAVALWLGVTEADGVALVGAPPVEGDTLAVAL